MEMQLFPKILKDRNRSSATVERLEPVSLIYKKYASVIIFTAEEHSFSDLKPHRRLGSPLHFF